MPGVGPPPSCCHGDSILTDEGSDAEPGDEVRDSELLRDSSPYHFVFSSAPLEPDGEESQRGDDSWSQDGGPRGQLERRWSLWHEFMKEHDHLDAWLQLAEQAIASSQSSAHITYSAAKDELRKFERLRREAGSRLVQLDALTQRNRTLARLFPGAMGARLLASARECGRRWDDVNVKLESITGRLQYFVSEWEEFEAQREGLAVWLTEMDVRLTAVDHLTGNSCEKLRQLQSFQDCVCVNSCRLNALLQHGEALIQRSEPSDAQRLETLLQELLRRCSYVYNNIARTHTRLLSMRLVFEDDQILSQASDSGCPSETLLDEEGAPDKHHQDVPAHSNPSRDLRLPVIPSLSPLHRPPPPPSRSSPTHEHLEWDPSVDIGRSVSRDDADSSYFSTSTGLGHRDGTKRWSYLTSFDSDSDASNQEADVGPEEWPYPTQPDLLTPVETRREEEEVEEEEALDHWTTSTPDRRDGEPVGFDGGRVKAWLRVQSSAPPERRTSCSRAVQTDWECHMTRSHVSPLPPHLHSSPRCHDATQHLPAPSSSSLSSSPLSHDLEVDLSSDWMKHRYQPQDEEETSEHHHHHLSERSSRTSSSSLLSPAVLYLLLAAALALLACLVWAVLEQPCHRSNRMHHSFQVSLRYVNGPPPT